MKALRLFGFLLACTVFVPVGVHRAHAQAESDSDVQARLDQMENDLQTLNRAVYKGETPPQSPPISLSPAPAAQATAANEVRLSQLEGAFRTLTGKMEETGHQLQLLQQSMDQITARLTALEQKQAASVPPSPVPSVSAPGAAPPLVEGTAPMTGTPSLPPEPAAGAMPPQPPVPGGLTKPDMAKPDMAKPDSAKPSLTEPDLAPSSSATIPAQPLKPTAKTTAGTLGTLAQPSEAGVAAGAAADTPANTPEGAYGQAYAQITAKKYAEAQAAFQSFLTRYPKHPLAANAQFWLGESFYGRGQYDKAAKAFAVAYQNYPQGPKGADSLLKLGMSLSGLGKTSEACLTWAQLQKQYPAASAVLARAAAEARKNACKI